MSLIKEEIHKPKKERIINLQETHFLSKLNPAKKNGDWNHTGSISKLQEIIEAGKFSVIKNDSNLETINDIVNVRVKWDEKFEECEIVSHSDVFDGAKYGIQICWDNNLYTFWRDFWEKK